MALQVACRWARVVLKLAFEYLGSALKPAANAKQCVVDWRQERISIRESVFPSVRPSICSSIGYACAKTAYLGCFRPRWDPVLNQIINEKFLKASFNTLSFYQTVCPTVSPHMSHVQCTQRHSPDTLLPGRACYRGHRGLLSYMYANSKGNMDG